jgi:hypothetical protein
VPEQALHGLMYCKPECTAESCTSLFLMAPRLNRMTLRMMTTENMNIGNTSATAILQKSRIVTGAAYPAAIKGKRAVCLQSGAGRYIK